MEKLKMHSPNISQENIARIRELFPGCVTEAHDNNGKLRLAVDFDQLRQELSEVIVEGPQERYHLNWPGKREALLAANAPIAKTLRPCREESVDFDTTENLFIEGDNLDALKLLQENYLGKIKMIYIDPPYNTGKDFIYSDNFAESADEFLLESGQKDEEGNRLIANTDSKGRFHSDWLSMIYSRLKLARNLLSYEGVLFISIDECECQNLKKLCDEIFGAGNFVGNVIWERAFAPKNDAKYISDSHDYLLIYSKSLMNFNIGLLPRSEEANERYKNPDNDPRGPWMSDNITVKTYSPSYDYEIATPSGKKVKPTDGRCWFTSKERMENLIKDNRIWFGQDGNNVPRLKRFLNEVQSGMVPISIWHHKEVGHNQEGRQEVKKLFDDKGFFDGPKPTRLLQRVLTVANTGKDSIILDFFAGSSTTAHAVMQLNAEDQGKRKFIMVQLPEECDEKTEAFKAGYKTIAEISKERIRRAGKKVVSDKWAVISKEEKMRYGCKELSRADCLAKGDGAGQGDLFAGQKAAAGRTLQSVRSDASSSSVDSVEHSRGAVSELNPGVYSISGDCSGIESRTGDPASSLRESGIPCRYGYFGSDTAATGDREDGVCSYKNTIHCPLTTKHCPDIGFRVLKVDSSNLADIYYTPDSAKQDKLNFAIDNIKPDRTSEDLLFQVLLDWGVELSLPIKKEKVADLEVYFVDNNALAACFVKNGEINDDFCKELAKRQPLRAVFRDSGFNDDSTKINAEQIFKLLSPHTEVRWI